MEKPCINKLTGHLVAVEVVLPVNMMGHGLVLNSDAVEVGVVFVLDYFCCYHHLL